MQLSTFTHTPNIYSISGMKHVLHLLMHSLRTRAHATLAAYTAHFVCCGNKVTFDDRRKTKELCRQP